MYIYKIKTEISIFDLIALTTHGIMDSRCSLVSHPEPLF